MSDPGGAYGEPRTAETPAVDQPLDVEDVIADLIDIVTNAKSMPLSSSAIIARDEVLELLETARETVPEEVRRARWMLREREEFLTKTRREAADVLEEARVQAERMVQRTEIVRQAEHRARRIVEDAEAEARRMRREAEDFVDHKLGAFEIVLDKTIKTVQAGREKLAATTFADSRAEDSAAGEGGDEDDFFDQDLH
ncbi:MAG TPA: ATP synthase F0 subunit B [Acidimicrobiales bacterium]|nr:ATP synthase F0 subunit B [Acidimicrobiales bacterium]